MRQSSDWLRDGAFCLRGYRQHLETAVNLCQGWLLFYGPYEHLPEKNIVSGAKSKTMRMLLMMLVFFFTLWTGRKTSYNA